MDEFGCDYDCGTVGKSIAKYSVPDDEYAGCRILPEKKTIASKADSRRELVSAIGMA